MPLLIDRDVTKFIVPKSLVVENFIEKIYCNNEESLKRTMISEFFNPKSILIEE